MESLDLLDGDFPTQWMQLHKVLPIMMVITPMDRLLVPGNVCGYSSYDCIGCGSGSY